MPLVPALSIVSPERTRTSGNLSFGCLLASLRQSLQDQMVGRCPFMEAHTYRSYGYSAIGKIGLIIRTVQSFSQWQHVQKIAQTSQFAHQDYAFFLCLSSKLHLAPQCPAIFVQKNA
jgi:hypothetical protein